MHEELMELLIHYDTALPSSHEHISGGGRGQKGNPLLTLPFSEKEQN